MADTLTMNDLHEQFKGHAQYKLVSNVTDKDDGKKIEIIDEDIFDTVLDGVEQEYDASVGICNLYTNAEGVIGAIEHSMGLITRANHQHIAHLCSFIGKKIIFE